ncbi:MAG: heavy metal translocating P-type ATPase, partial [Helicobacter sp.]|nr:heavy metal translocating P-type ATPase [Helicobacter sp.]
MNCYNNQCETIYAKSKEKFLHQTFFISAILLYCVALLVDLEILRFHLNPLILTFLFVFCYFTLGFGILKEAFRSLIKREYFNENTLMVLASLSAFCIGESAEAVAILIFYRIGESLQERVVEKAKKQIRSLSALKIESARILRENTQVSISPKEIQEGDILIVFAGERIPADGKIIKGESNIDNSALNGES